MKIMEDGYHTHAGIYNPFDQLNEHHGHDTRMYSASESDAFDLMQYRKRRAL
ncbi:MAG TPA: hypothetical protein VJJ23_06280 [Candidatus Nanoarchaeia archaeon]|nr:hypothetical protein [Candidatus Nanoarchaeia archaeon]